MDLNKSELLFREKESGCYFILNESDNYGFDCYSFESDKSQIDGFIPFCADDCDEDEMQKIWEWLGQPVEKRVDICLKELGTSLAECEQLDDEELYEELIANT